MDKSINPKQWINQSTLTIDQSINQSINQSTRHTWESGLDNIAIRNYNQVKYFENIFNFLKIISLQRA